MAFLQSLGRQLEAPWLSKSRSTEASQSLAAALHQPSRRDPKAVTNALAELVTTERSYVKRMRALHNSYAVPLTNFAKSSTTRIIGQYEARTMFSQVDKVLDCNALVLEDFEHMWDVVQGNGGEVCYPGDDGGWASTIAEALKRIAGPYQAYMANYDEAKATEQRLQKSDSFRHFCDRTKQAMYDEGMGRIGLRELIMEPCQRVPRYKMLLDRA